MSTQELTQAITEPARQTGITLETGLTQALLENLEQSPGGLPLLQYALTELWRRQQDNQLSLSVYHQLGGVTGTLKQQADEVYESLSPEQQKTAEHIFLNLTQLGEGAEDTRRQITQDSLISGQHPEAGVLDVVKQLADANLVVTDNRGESTSEPYSATVDVAHEALIRNWPKQREGLDDNRDLLRQQRKIELAAKDWSQQDTRQQNDYLLQGRQLTDAKRFVKEHGNTFPLSQTAEQYLHRSLTHRLRSRLKLIGFGAVVPLCLAIYAGVQTATYLKLRPHWDLVYSYDAENNKIPQASLVRALEEINLVHRSLSRVILRSADLRSAILLSADFRNNLNRTTGQLTGINPPLLCNVAFPPDIVEAGVSPNRDCDAMALRLSERHGYTLEDANRIVEEARQKQWN